MKKKLSPIEAAEKIRQAAKEKQISFAEQDRIEDHSQIVERLLKKVMLMSAAFISDLSMMSDFSEYGVGTLERSQEEAQWSTRLQQEFGVFVKDLMSRSVSDVADEISIRIKSPPNK